MADATDQLRIDLQSEGANARLGLEGELDVHTAPNLGDALQKVLDDGATTIVIDASRLRFCDSSGIQVLVQARERAVESGGKIVMENVHGPVERVLSVTGLLELFS